MKNRMITSVLSCVLVMSVAVSEAKGRKPAKPPKYRLTEIPAPPMDDLACVDGLQTWVYARRLNDSALAVGYASCYVATGDPAAPYVSQVRAFMWTEATGTVQLPNLTSAPIDVLGRDVNASGTLVGRESAADGFRGVLWPASGGVIEVLPTDCAGGIPFTFADGVNDQGTIAGRALRTGPDGRCRTFVVLLRTTGETILGPTSASVSALNNDEVVVGSFQASAYKWSPTLGTVVLSSPGEGQSKIAWELNDAGVVVGHTLDGLTGCPIEALAWAPDGTETLLPTRRGLGAAAYGINEVGHIVGNEQPVSAGFCNTSNVESRALVWIEGRAHDLTDRVRRADDVQLTFGSAINSSGQILARGIRTGEPALPCPGFDIDPDTGEQIYNDTYRCHREYAFLLTPKKKHRDDEGED